MVKNSQRRKNIGSFVEKPRHSLNNELLPKKKKKTLANHTRSHNFVKSNISCYAGLRLDSWYISMKHSFIIVKKKKCRLNITVKRIMESVSLCGGRNVTEKIFYTDSQWDELILYRWLSNETFFFKTITRIDGRDIFCRGYFTLGVFFSGASLWRIQNSVWIS